MKNKAIIFDLDDTLYNEIDFLISAYKDISKKLSVALQNAVSETDIFDQLYQSYKENRNPFNEILLKYEIDNMSKNILLDLYRNHVPEIKLHPEIDSLLKYLKESNYLLGLITDGRSIQQRNKISALDIEQYFEGIVISEEFKSEKPNVLNFKFFENLFNDCTYIYVGDNPIKDFIGPNKLGWTTICLIDNGRNIHKQDFDISPEKLPNFYVSNLKEILTIVAEI